MSCTASPFGPAKVTVLPDGKITIETPRLLLRGAEDLDVDGLHDCFSDEIAMKYWSSLPHDGKDATVKWIKKMRESKRNGLTDFVIVLQTHQSRPSIGKVGVWSDNEIGFIIARKYWKQGFANEAVTAVLDHLFGIHAADLAVVESLNSVFGARDQWPIDITADVDPRNELSLKALHRLGFTVYETKEKTIQIGGEWVDSVYLSLQKKDWLATRTTSPS